MPARIAAIIFFLILPVVGLADTSSSGVVRGIVTGRSERPATSGLIKTWVGVSIAEKSDARRIEMFIPYMTEKQQLPAVGKLCEISYHIENIDGAIGRHIKKVQDAWVVDRFECGSKQP